MNSGNWQDRDTLIQAFCYLDYPTKRVIPPQKIREQFEGFRSMGPHCIEGGETLRIWRVFTPTSPAADIETVRHVRQAYQHSQRLRRSTPFRDLVDSGAYGFAVLLTDEARATRLRALFAERPLPDSVPFAVHVINETE